MSAHHQTTWNLPYTSSVACILVKFMNVFWSCEQGSNYYIRCHVFDRIIYGHVYPKNLLKICYIFHGHVSVLYVIWRVSYTPPMDKNTQKMHLIAGHFHFPTGNEELISIINSAGVNRKITLRCSNCSGKLS